MKQDVPDVVVQAALAYTKTTTLTEALLVLMDAEIKKCADETCRKEFLFQDQENLGHIRAPRSDAIYCSVICGRRKTQRLYRRRTRAKARDTT